MFRLLLVLVHFIWLNTGSTNVNDCTIKDSNVRLRFLGGYTDPTDSNDLCYVYELHLRNNMTASSINDDCGIYYESGDTIASSSSSSSSKALEWSMQVCSSDSDARNGRILSDYLKSVSLARPQDSYYIDNLTFYYTVHDYISSSSSSSDEYDNKVTLCFHDEDDNNVKLIGNTYYCLEYAANDNVICSDHGIHVTDVCGLNSIPRQTNTRPPAGIDYVPKKNHIYDIQKESKNDNDHGGGLMNGKGKFEYDPFLVTLRGWWINECKLNNTNKGEMTIYLNDDYFNETNDLVDSPITLPIYDKHFVSIECEYIAGVIIDYKHDTVNEEFILYINIDVSPLIYFKDAKFDIKEFSSLTQITSEIDELIYDTSDVQVQRRRRRRILNVKAKIEEDNKRKVSKILANQAKNNLDHEKLFQQRKKRSLLDADYVGELPISYKITGEVKKVSLDDPYSDIDLLTCNVTFEAGIAIVAGFSLHTSWFNVHDMSLKMGLKPFVSLKLHGMFGITSDSDESAFNEEYTAKDIAEKEWIIFHSRDITSNTYFASIGPIAVNIKGTFNLDIDLHHPAFGIEFTVKAAVSGEKILGGGWNDTYGVYSINEGRQLGFETDWDDFKSTVDGYDNLDFKVGLYWKPGLKFGLWNADALAVKFPIGLPEFAIVIDWTKDVSTASVTEWFKDNSVKYDQLYTCQDDETLVVLYFDIRFSLNIEIIFEKIAIPYTKKKIFIRGLDEWSPEEPLYTLVLKRWLWTHWCASNSDGDGQRQLTSELDTDDMETFTNYEYVHVKAKDNDFSYGLSWDDANNFCGQYFGTKLATIESSADYLKVKEVLDLDSEFGAGSGNYLAWIGLNDIDYEGDYVWADGVTGVDSTIFSLYWDTGYEGGSYENCVVMNGNDNYEWHDVDCYRTDIYAFVCDLNFTYNDIGRYVGIYTGTNDLSWNGANSLCESKYGSELATIHDDYENTLVFEAIADFGTSYAWIGISNISSSSEYDWTDGTNSAGYTNWDTFQPFVTDGYCGEINPSSDEKWDTYSCDWANNVVICNQHNMYNTFESGNYIGVYGTVYGVDWYEAENYCNYYYGASLATVSSGTVGSDIEMILNSFYNDSNLTTSWVGNNECSVLTNDNSGSTSTSTQSCQQSIKGFICEESYSTIDFDNFVAIETNDAASYTWYEANSYCNDEYGTTLATINSEASNKTVEAMMASIDATRAWFGLSDSSSSTSSRAWTWMDGTWDLEFEGWIPTEPNDYSGSNTEECVEMRLDSTPQGWNDLSCFTDLTAFICNRPYSTKEMNGFIGVYTNEDYYSWDDANSYCQTVYGTTLASIRSASETSDILEIMDDISMIYAWIGLLGTVEYLYSGQNVYNYEWSDGTSYDYTNWNEDESDYTFFTTGSYGYVSMAFYDSGEWRKYNSIIADETTRNAFICNQESTSSAKVVSNSDGETESDGDASGASGNSQDNNGTTFYIAISVLVVILIGFMFVAYRVRLRRIMNKNIDLLKKENEDGYAPPSDVAYVVADGDQNENESQPVRVY